MRFGKIKSQFFLYFRVLRCKYFVLNNNKENLGKLGTKDDEGIFLGYSIHSKSYRVYNKRILVVEESIHVTFDEHNYISRKVISDDVEEVEQNLEKLDIKPSSTRKST